MEQHGPDKGPLKVSLRLPAELVRALQARAEKDGIPGAELIRRAIDRELFLRGEEERGTKVVLEDATGGLRQVRRR